MAREEEVQYEQDRLGNENRRLDDLRAQEGKNGLTNDDGLVEIGSADTGSSVLIYSKPTHAQQVIPIQLTAFNSVGSGTNTFVLEEATLDGSNNITSTTQRSVPIEVSSGETRIVDYHGLPADRALSVDSEFQGQIGVAVISDHQEEHEPASEQTEA